MKSYQFIYFNSWNNQNAFIYDIFNDMWVLDTKADLSEFWKYEATNDCLLHYKYCATRLFQYENCKCNGDGLQVGFYEFTESE